MFKVLNGKNPEPVNEIFRNRNETIYENCKDRLIGF